MKVLSIVSSCRQNGNTERVVKTIENSLIRFAAEKNIKIEIGHLSLGKEDIQFCRGCRTCFNKGESYCPIKDSVSEIKDKINAADGIIIASPVYVEDVNGIMKNWIDRMAYICHRPAFYEKFAVIITTSGGGSTNHSLNTLKNALTSWGFQILSQKKFRMGALMEDKQIEALYGTVMRKIAIKVFRFFDNRKRAKPSLYSLVAFKIQQKHYQKLSDTGSIDYAYWKANGWLDSHISFYNDQKSKGLRYIFAKTIGYLVSKFFI